MKNAWQEIRKRLHPQVFQPFWIVLKNGEVLHVAREFGASVSPNGARGAVADPKRHIVFYEMKDVVAVKDHRPLKGRRSPSRRANARRRQDAQ